MRATKTHTIQAPVEYQHYAFYEQYDPDLCHLDWEEIHILAAPGYNFDDVVFYERLIRNCKAAIERINESKQQKRERKC